LSGCYNSIVRRFALAIVVALLTFSASGFSALVIAESCTGYEQPGQEDGACPPTCVTCGCCAQAVEPAILSAVRLPETPAVDVHALFANVPQTRPREILHVPRLRLP
jgi:hypothetical protein